MLRITNNSSGLSKVVGSSVLGIQEDLMKQSCYMCERDATSKEHVPPKCLFPKQKDLPSAIDLCKNLIRVPSGDTHNMEESRDNEYLLYVLRLNVSNNVFAFKQFATKILRAYNRNHGLMNFITEDHCEIIAANKNGFAINTLIVKADMPGSSRCLEQMARALSFLRI